jgi:long-chain acyl-CoA synthetase
MSATTNATLVGLLVERAAASPEKLALIANERGRWLPTVLGELVEHVSQLAVGLEAAGIAPGDRVAIVLGNVPRWLTVDLAVQAVGAVSVAVPEQPPDAGLADALRSVGAVAVVVGDAVMADQVDHLVEDEQLAQIRMVAYLGSGDGDITGVDDIALTGAGILAGRPDAFRALVARVDPSAPATITYTDGASGAPRPVVHSACASLAAATVAAESLGLVYQDVTVTLFDPANPFERSATLYPALVSGAVLAYPEHGATSLRSELEVRPTFTHTSADRLRHASGTVQARFNRNRGVKRLAAKWWERSALRAVRKGRAPSSLAVKLVGRSALKSLGWNNLRYLMVMGGEVPHGVVTMMLALGLPVRSGYLLAETGLLAVGSADSESLPVLAGVSVNEHDGQLVVACDGLGSEYADGTPLPRTSRGELLTGDLGQVGGGGVLVRGPGISAVDLDDGSSVLLAETERRLRNSPYISRAAVRPEALGLSARIEIDSDVVGDWATQRTLLFTTFASLAELGEVKELIADEVAGLATEVVHHDLLTSPFQQGRDITRTGKNIYRGLPQQFAEEASIKNTESAAVD